MTPKIKGQNAWAIILCAPNDDPKAPTAAPALFEGLFYADQGLANYWSTMSGGLVDLYGSTVFGWYTLNKDSAWTTGDRGRGELVAEARATATAHAARLSGFMNTLAFVTISNGGGNIGADVASTFKDPPGEAGWRYCTRCRAVVRWIEGSAARCRVPGLHAFTDSYTIVHDVPFPGGQGGWRRCLNCQVLVFKTANPAPCPESSGPHDLRDGTDYVLNTNPATALEEKGWRWCSKCQELGYGDGGPCPLGVQTAAGKVHDHSQSAQYCLSRGQLPSLSFLQHEMGHAFGLDHAFSWSRDMGDFTSDARPGAYQDGADIMGLGGGVAGGPPAAFPTLLFRYAGPAISAAARLKMGWAAPEDVRAFSAPGAGTQTVTLRPLYAPTGAVTSSPRVVQVIEPARGRVYTVEYRPPTGWDAGLKDKPVIVHAMRSLYTAGQDCWRRCGLCQGLVFAGRTHCPAGGVHQGDVGHDYAVPVGSAAGGQPGWRLCDKCSGIFFTGHGNGVCPRDGEHRATGGLEYSLATSAAGAWRWCSKCQSLSHGGRAVAGPCPAGGFHDHAASGNYHVAWDGGTQRRDRWRECARCQGLYHAQIGACKGGLVHQLDGNDFALTHDLAGAPGESGWKWCKKCYTLAYNAAGQGPGWCAAGDKHDHSESGTYVLPIDAEASAAQLRWYHCSKCSAMNYRSANRSPGTCSADRGVHDDEEQQQFLFAHDTTAVPGAGFRWCNKCECLVLSSGAAAPCAKGDNHVTTAGASYVVRTEPSAPNRQDAAWRTCTTCKVLMRLSSPDGLSEQPCAVAGTTHKPGAVFYYPTMIGIREDPFWRRCKKCETLAFWDGTTAAGPCPADGEKHDHGGSSFYDPPSFAGDVTEIVANLELNQPVASDGNGITFELLSFNDAGATVRLRMG